MIRPITARFPIGKREEKSLRLDREAAVWQSAKWNATAHAPSASSLFWNRKMYKRGKKFEILHAPHRESEKEAVKRKKRNAQLLKKEKKREFGREAVNVKRRDMK